MANDSFVGEGLNPTPYREEKAKADLLLEELWEVRAEIARLKAGGCARDQTTTQFCAEAVALQVDNDALRALLNRAEHFIKNVPTDEQLDAKMLNGDTGRDVWAALAQKEKP